MKTNVGRIDRAFGLVLGLFMIASPYLNFPVVWSNPTIAYVIIGVGAVLVATAMLKFCLLYRVLGLSTCSPS